MEKQRRITMCDFIVSNKTLCYRAFKQGIEHKYYKTDWGQKLVDKCRDSVGYSSKTWDGDIYHTIWRYYKMIVVDATLIDW
jgi:hypothetical protein